MAKKMLDEKKYEDGQGNQYIKDAQGNLYIRYKDEKEKREVIVIPDFQEGDYGLWVADQAPYFLDGDYIVKRSTGEKAKKDKVLAEEENEFLKEENRIKDGHLWIHAGEEIIFPHEKEKENANQQTDAAKNNSRPGEVGPGSAAAENSQAESSENNSKSGSSGSGQNTDSGSGEGTDEFYVCSGAELKCSFGSEKSTLEVVASHNICIQDNMIASMQDYKPLVNIKPFGKCKSMSNPTVASATAANNGVLKPMPCQPNIVAPWVNAKLDMLIADNPALIESSKCTCTYGGVITVDDPGQDLVTT